MIVHLFLIAHIAGDFLFRPGMATRRTTTWLRSGGFRASAFRLLAYAVCVAAASFAALPPGCAWIAAASLTALHGMVGLAWSLVVGRHPERDGLAAFLIEQFVQVSTVIALVRLLHPAGSDIGSVLRFFTDRFAEAQVARGLLLVLLYLVCLQPAEGLVRRVLHAVQAGEHEPEGGAAVDGSADRTGRAIGMLERAVILTLGLLGQPGAAGLVVAAKSVARFNRLSTDRAFAERYLVGTLASVLTALLCIGYGSIAR